MAYGTIKVDNITFTNSGVDETITVSGIVQSVSGDLTVTGTVQGANIIGTSTVSGATVTGDIGSFTTITGGVATLTSGVFASGVEATPSISIGTVSNGFYSPAENQVALSTNGTGRLFVDASGNVKVENDTSPELSLRNSDGSIVSGDSLGTLFFATADVNISGTHRNVASVQALAEAEFVGTNNARTSLVFSTNGNNTNLTEKLRITSAGLVGIGTSDPQSIFDIKTSASNGALSQGAYIYNPGTGDNAGAKLNLGVSGGGTIAENRSAGIAGYYNGAGTALGFYTTSIWGTGSQTVRAVIDNSGRVGIGTTNVDELLHVESDGATPKIKVESTLADSSPGFRVTNDARSYDIRIDGTNDNLQFYDATASEGRVAIDSSGRLLVGTSSAVGAGSVGELLQVGFSGGSRAILANTSTSLASGALLGQIDFTTNVGSSISTGASIKANCDGTAAAGDAPTRLVFSVTADGASSPTPRMQINSSGSVWSVATAADALRVSNTAAAGKSYANFVGRYSGTTPGSGTNSFVVWTDGDAQNTNGIYTTLTSDERFKQDIVEIGSQWDDIKGISLKKFRYKNDPTGELQLGVIAQELQQVCPGLVTTRTATEEDVDASGGLVAEGDEVLGWKMSILPLKAVKALQEAMERIEALEASNTDLLARVSALESA